MRLSLLSCVFAVFLMACGPTPSPGSGGGGSGGAPTGGGGTGGAGGSCAPTPFDVGVTCDGFDPQSIIIPPGLFYAQSLEPLEGDVTTISFEVIVGKKVNAPNGVLYTCAINLSNQVFFAVLPATDTKPPLPNDPIWKAFSFEEHVTADTEMHAPIAFESFPISLDTTQRVWVMWQTTLASHQDKELQCLFGCSSGGAQGFVSDENGPWEADATGTTVELGASGEIPCAE